MTEALTPERWRRVRELFEGALARAPSEREGFLDEACAGDSALRREVASLLSADERAGPIDEGRGATEAADRNSARGPDSRQQPGAAEHADTKASLQLRLPSLEEKDRGSSPLQDLLDFAFTAGEVLSDRYRVVRFLAHGGMGEVYEAEDLELHERVALKTIRPEIARDRKTFERFRREIQLARKVTHPNICRTFDLKAHRTVEGREVPFVTMELLAGETLADRIESVGRMSEGEALPILRQMVAALAAAHEAGVIHRDFKSANVVLVPVSGGTRAVVTDFGLARDTAGEGRHRLTETGAFLGTPAYMAPEQVRGEPATPAVDIYALGLVLYEMLTGRLPFEGTTLMAIALRRLEEPPPSPRSHLPDLDRRWEAAILNCLEPDPADRFQEVTDVLRAVEGVGAARGPKRRWRRGVGPSLIAVGLLVASSVGYSLFVARSPRKTPDASTGLPRGPAPLRPAVAVLGFKDLSPRPESAWLSGALAELLTMELAGGERLRLVPGESVARLKSDLALGEAETLGRETLGRVRAYLGTDFVVVGSYFVGGGTQDRRLRVDIRVQEAATAETTTAVSETGSEAELLDLVSRAGSQLRTKLGVGEIGTEGTAALRAAQPSSPRAARLYSEGLAKLRGFDGLGARDLLQKAVAAEPTHPLPHAALAQAWSALGYEAKALEEARRAFELSVKLPREDRLSVEARYREAAGEWDKAMATYRTLWGFFPDNLDYGLRFASAETEGGKGKDALATLEALRSLPGPMGQDPRIDVQEAWTATRLGDWTRVRTVAERAVQQGEPRGARLLVAQARVREAEALRNLGDLEGSKARASQARQVYESAGDRIGTARAVSMIANVLWQQGDLEGARRLYQEALSLGRSIAAKRVVSASLNNIALILRYQGDLAESRRLCEEAMTITREIGNRPALSNQMSNTAEVLLLQGNLAEATRLYEDALALRRELGNRDLAVSLVGLGLLALKRGGLAEARARYEEGEAAAREAGNRRFLALALLGLGHVLSAEGELPAARRKMEEGLAMLLEMGERGTVAEVRLALASLHIEEGERARAEEMVREAIGELRKEKRSDREADAWAVLARALLTDGRTAEARRAVDQATSLVKKSQDAGARLNVGIVAARVLASSGRSTDLSAAMKNLEASLAEATRFGFVPEQLEARLALCEVERASGRTAAAHARLEGLEKEASALGFRFIAGRAARLRTGRVR